ncbi:hypothetical protein HGM15179_003867 [Zosterops borbonicus]|uniref:Uncharacterized protein n=1 Tax=Zosterops borbonicus TaxID=364589 RepID=A0A8K1GSW2_9PASS|nr:hypothetical protein HGM15179_003867 [Zosterops borbonicus]
MDLGSLLETLMGLVEMGDTDMCWKLWIHGFTSPRLRTWLKSAATADFEENNLLCNPLPSTAGADSPSQMRAQFRGLAEFHLVILKVNIGGWHAIWTILGASEERNKNIYTLKKNPNPSKLLRIKLQNTRKAEKFAAFLPISWQMRLGPVLHIEPFLYIEPFSRTHIGA